MTKKEMLARIRDLETIIELYKKRDELLEQIKKNQEELATPKILVNPPNDVACEHQYPNPWLSVSPPHCIKCGKAAGMWTVYGSSSLFTLET